MRVIRAMSWILTFVAIGAAAAAWFTPQSDVDAETAGEISLRALADAGVEDAEVIGTPTRGFHVPSVPTTETTTTTAPADTETGSETTTTTDDSEISAEKEIDVWKVVIGLNGEEFDVLVDADKGQLAYVDDLVGENNDQRALTEDQWESVEYYSDDDRRERWVQRNIAGSVGAGVIVVVGFVLARRTGDLAS